MFKNKQEMKDVEELSNSSNIIGKGTVMTGDIETYGNIRVEGKIVGNMKTKSKAACGHSSYIEGNILAQNAEIAGHVTGRVEVSELLILKPSAVINGDIITNKLIVESGATFNGGCKMGVTIKEIKIGDQPEEISRIRKAE
ncbi:polymer-forming cytoskeletal protein [Reichenbachiella agarivorans]|uniref:Polymer-forming cytoskeletal protein n=1 Tax=Reichenbachiella agarivorans TaxID=2979464 RepID=A0ABY6CV35_9BACT|nr:polymer-forming cytoskeletal protein [Reichenbachiella agarivorans]UXP33764.1 polymer-forming cytoskeletal protein [Reichenbachiella agarivorans]